MVAFHIVLWHDAIILDSGLVQKVCGISFLKQGIADVFLVSENLVDGAGSPFRFPCTGKNTVTLQTGGNLIHAESF